MKLNNTPFNLLILCLINVGFAHLHAQEAHTVLHAPDKLNRLLETKIVLDKKASEEKLYSIQVHYGNFESTTAVLDTFKKLFPNFPTELIFETPNYKIRAGSYATEREALAALGPIKRKFPAAFVLKP